MGDTDVTVPAEGAPAQEPTTPPAPDGGAPPTPETPPADAPKEEPKQEAGPKSSDWATFHRKAKELRKQQEAVRTRETEIKRIEDLRARAAEDPSAAAELFGSDIYERWTMKLLGQEKKAGPEDKLRELEEWKAKVEQSQREANERSQAQQRQAVVQQAQDMAYGIAKAEPTKYRHLVRLGDSTAKQLIWSKAQEMAADDPELSDTAVLAAVEADLIEFKKLLADEAAADAAQSNGASANGSKTLTSRGVSGQSTPGNGVPSLSLDPHERDKEILKRFTFFR